MTPKELAQILNGRSYTNEITKEEEAQAKAAGLVVAFGASDDLLELRGVINDEFSAYEGTEFGVTKAGLVLNDCKEEDCPYFAKLMKQATKVDLLWCDEADGPPSWTFKTAIPHETFEVLEDGEVYCRGIVFALADVPA